MHDCEHFALCQIVARHHPFDLQFLRAIHYQDAVDEGVFRAFCQERYTDETVWRLDLVHELLAEGRGPQSIRQILNEIRARRPDGTTAWTEGATRGAIRAARSH